jgi:hypothetical protein
VLLRYCAAFAFVVSVIVVSPPNCATLGANG